MQYETRRNIGTALLVVSVVMLALGIYGMLQTPRPEWSRNLAIPAFVIIIAARSLRRRPREQA